ncbi:MAG TPA: phosphoribosylformylglycinamidine synthase subunit PurL [Dehalococcoidia bacterium]|nr:phosphoribosylformylglycinamidine synthase subunit PurL [Dehalococcoidia bacterium]
MDIDNRILDEIALSRDEYHSIVGLMGRVPNNVELGIFGAMWSEHCGYKHSKHLIKTLPSTSEKVLSKSGAENAGAIDIGDNHAIVFKVESHNHPSAIEPFQGAATGVGGIVRDILAMGARPIALLNSLRFGSLSNPNTEHLYKGVVDGISWYGNCLGIPDVGGEIYFEDCYEDNPLVNALCVGLVQINKIASSSVKAVGNLVILVGAETGRDGIHGASGLASRSLDTDQEMRPTVQVGNPFLEKLLIEGCLEALETGLIDGIQDLGAAGLTSSCVEAASKANLGMEIDVSKVPVREKKLSAYEIMLSESQERMLLFINPSNLNTINSIFKKWGIHSASIGKIIQEPNIIVTDGNETIATIPIKYLTEAPSYKPTSKQSSEQICRKTLAIPNTKHKEQPTKILLQLLSSINICDRSPIYKKYDHQVQTNTVVGPAQNSAVLRIKNTSKLISLSIDGNSRYSYLDPFIGAQIAVAEACRNVSCSGAEPIALTDCLNFANPERPEIYFELEQSIAGMSKASMAFKTPIVSGNASLYNQSENTSIYPTPIIGCLGVMQNTITPMTASFKSNDLDVFLLGSDTLDFPVNSLAGSEYLKTIHNLVKGTPSIDLDLEHRVQTFCRALISQRVISSAHDCSEGGLGVTIAESCILGSIGFDGEENFNNLCDWRATLFGESQSRIVVSCVHNNSNDLFIKAANNNVPILKIGKTAADIFKVGSLINLKIDQISKPWSHGLPRK